MSAAPTTAAPTGRKKIVQDKGRSDTTPGHESRDTSTPEGAKEGGELPHGGAERRIEQLFAPLEDGRTLHQGWSPQCDKVPSPSEKIWGVLKTTSIQAGEFQPEHNKLLPSGLEPRPMIEVKEGDILLTCAGPRVRCGVSCLVRQTRKRLMMSGKMYRFRVDLDRTDARYVEAFLQTERARQAIDKMKTGSSDSGLNLTHARFRRLLIPVAPLPEQQQIVEEIEKQFTRLEVGVAALRRVWTNLKRYRAAVLKAACEGRLVPTETELAKSENRKFETGEELLARILAERREKWQGRGKYKEPASPELADLPRLPEGWTWATTDQLTSVITDGEHITPERSDSGVLLLSARNVRDGRISVDDVNHVPQHEYDRIAKRLVIAPGDVLLSCSGSVGRSAVVPEGLLFTLVRSVAVLKPLAGMGKFLSIALRSPLLKRQITAKQTQTAQANIFQGKIKVLCVPLPPLAEQKRIGAEVERRLSVVDELEAVVSVNLQRAIGLRQSVLQQAFAGKLVTQEITALATNVIKLPESQSRRPPNTHFARALLSAEIIHRLHGEPTFGRIKHQKIFHLCEHIAQIEQINGQYHREAAGPLDNKLIYANEAELKKQKWYQEVPRHPFGHAYQPLAKAGGHRKYAEQYWPVQLPLVEKVVELMRTWHTDRCEIFCTTYAAWNDLLLWGKEPAEGAILREILDHWHESKTRFPKERWQKLLAG